MSRTQAAGSTKFVHGLICSVARQAAVRLSVQVAMKISDEYVGSQEGPQLLAAPRAVGGFTIVSAYAAR